MASRKLPEIFQPASVMSLPGEYYLQWIEGEGWTILKDKQTHGHIIFNAPYATPLEEEAIFDCVIEALNQRDTLIPEPCNDTDFFSYTKHAPDSAGRERIVIGHGNPNTSRQSEFCLTIRRPYDVPETTFPMNDALITDIKTRLNYIAATCDRQIALEFAKRFPNGLPIVDLRDIN